jgi:hypothetical protein
MTVNPRIDFLCVGAQKSGTTTLRAYLREHPSLIVPDSEPHFFDNDMNRFDDDEIVDKYHCQFQAITAVAGQGLDHMCSSNHNFLRGEVTPIYMYWLSCLPRIYAYNPDIKLIFILRNPMARAYSHWSMEYARGAEKLSFSEAIRTEKISLADSSIRQHRVHSYIDRGYYCRQLVRFIDQFSPQNLLFLSAELLYSEPVLVLQQISEFLGIPCFQVRQMHHHRKGSYDKDIAFEDWRYIYEQLSADISNLESILPWDISSWHLPWSGVE